MKPPASAERRTAEWLTALSPVMEREEHSPLGHPDSTASRVAEHDAHSPVSQIESSAAAVDASSVDERGKLSPGSASHADACPRATGVHQLDSPHTFFGQRGGEGGGVGNACQ